MNSVEKLIADFRKIADNEKQPDDIRQAAKKHAEGYQKAWDSKKQ